MESRLHRRMAEQRIAAGRRGAAAAGEGPGRRAHRPGARARASAGSSPRWRRCCRQLGAAIARSRGEDSGRAAPPVHRVPRAHPPRGTGTTSSTSSGACLQGVGGRRGSARARTRCAHRGQAIDAYRAALQLEPGQAERVHQPGHRVLQAGHAARTPRMPRATCRRPWRRSRAREASIPATTSTTSTRARCTSGGARRKPTAASGVRAGPGAGHRAVPQGAGHQRQAAALPNALGAALRGGRS